MAEMLRSRGIDAVCVSGQTPRDERVKILDRFRAGDIRALCSMAILTTGFDAPNVDLLALCRPTSSVSLHVQILGRGSRPSSGKENALILDFARNVNRNGAINAPLFDFSSGRVASRPEPRQCEACGHFEAPQARVCSNCGESLVVEEHRERQAQLEEKADRNISPLAGVDDDVVDDDDDDWDFTPSIVQAQPTVFKVKSWSFDIHKKPGSPDSLKITYEVEGYRYRTCSAWLTAWHRSGAAWHGQQAWAALLKDNASRILPASAADAVVLAPKLLQRPDFVRITMDNGFPRVTPARDPASRAA
jgi:DNA repair protein RadD